MIHNVIIIGAGPAGYTAALYAARANMAPLMFEGAQPGGQLMITTDVENYPGFPKGVQGPEMMQLFREQAARFGTQIITDIITKVDFSKRPFTIWDSKGSEFKAKSVIIATGAQAKWLGIPSETEFNGRGVSACATCDGFFFRGKAVAVVGGGDTAMEEATFLANLASKVYVIHRRDTLRASKIMQDRAKNNPKIEFVWNAAIEEIVGDQMVRKLRLKSTVDGTSSELDVDGVFIAIGHKPTTDLFAGQLELNEAGYIVTHSGTYTSVEGVFAAGDVQDHVYRQAVTAAGTGCMAAIDAERWLAGLPVETPAALAQHE